MTLMLAIGTAGIEVATQLFVKCKLKANTLICLINITLESMQPWDQVVQRPCYCQVFEEGKHIIVLRLSATPLTGHVVHSERHASTAWAGGGITSAFCRTPWVVALAQRGARVRAFEILYVKK